MRNDKPISINPGGPLVPWTDAQKDAATGPTPPGPPWHVEAGWAIADALRGLGGWLWAGLAILTIPFWVPIQTYRDASADSRTRFQITLGLVAAGFAWWLLKRQF